MSSHGNSNKSYMTHAMVMLGFTIVLGVFAFWLVIHHRAVPDAVHQVHAERSASG